MLRNRILSLLLGGLLFAGLIPGTAQEPAPPPEEFPQTSAREENLSAPPRVWLDPDGNPLPFRSDAEVLEFLRTAKIIPMKKLKSGITKPLKVLLEKDGLRMHAIYHDVDISKRVAKMRSGKIERNFRDSYLFQLAAYKLSLLLGLDNVPPTILRRVRGKSGSLQAWVEKAMTQQARTVKKIVPPNMTLWNRQMSLLFLFDELISNTDRHNSNILIDSNWRIWLIDHTRAFRRNADLRRPYMVVTCERTLWKNLQTLDQETAKKEFKGLLLGNEIKAIFKRRDEIVKLLRKLIQENGETQVLFTLEPPVRPRAPALFAGH